MELARIRSKSRQESADSAAGTNLSESAASRTGNAVPPALSLPDDLPEDLFDLQPALVSFPGPAAVCPSAPVPRFDPLSVILAGRERDCSDCQRADTESDVPLSSAAAEPVYQEFLCFRLGNEEYGINIMDIKEIIKPRELTEVPRTPAFVDGVLSLRGVIVPVFTLRKRLGMSLEYEGNQERIIIVRSGDGLYGLRVDQVIDVVRIGKEHREAAPAVLEGTAREFVGGIGRTGNRMVIILDSGKVIDTALDEVG